MKQRLLFIVGFVLLTLLGGVPVTTHAARAAAPAPVVYQQTTTVSAGSVLLADSWFNKFYRGLVSSLRSRKAMFQFALVGMLVALWIIWWRK